MLSPQNLAKVRRPRGLAARAALFTALLVAVTAVLSAAIVLIGVHREGERQEISVARRLTEEFAAHAGAAMARGDVSALAELEPVQAVDALQKLCHDLLACRVGAQPRYFAAADLPEPPGVGPLTRWSRALTKEARTAEHPFNAGLMLESLVAQARHTLNSRH